VAHSPNYELETMIWRVDRELQELERLDEDPRKYANSSSQVQRMVLQTLKITDLDLPRKKSRNICNSLTCIML